MTGRHTLYGQSLVRSANSMANLAGGITTKHWKKTWMNPPKKQENGTGINSIMSNSGASSGDTTTNESTPQPPSIPVYDFEVKTWVLVEELGEAKPDDDSSEDFLDLARFSYEHPGGKKTEGLSDADIRGAVGGADMIEFSNSAAKTMDKPEDKGNLEEQTPVSATPDVVSDLLTPVAKNDDESTPLQDESVPESSAVSVEPQEVKNEETPNEESGQTETPNEAVSEAASEAKDGDGDIKME